MSIKQENSTEKRICKGYTKQGKACSVRALPHSDYCLGHQKQQERKAKLVTHGLYAKPDTLGIPTGYDHVYQDYYNSEDPTNLKREIALLRTLHDALADSFNKSRADRQDKIVKVMESTIENFFISQKVDTHTKGLSKTFAEKIMGLLYPLLEEMLPKYELNSRDVASLVGLLDTIRKTAESMKKIQDGLVFNVSMELDYFISFLKLCVLPNTTFEEQRVIIQSARDWIGKTKDKAKLLAAKITDDSMEVDYREGIDEDGTPKHLYRIGDI